MHKRFFPLVYMSIFSYSAGPQLLDLGWKRNKFFLPTELSRHFGEWEWETSMDYNSVYSKLSSLCLQRYLNFIYHSNCRLPALRIPFLSLCEGSETLTVLSDWLNVHDWIRSALSSSKFWTGITRVSIQTWIRGVGWWIVLESGDILSRALFPF